MERNVIRNDVCVREEYACGWTIDIRHEAAAGV